jgi:hypothetical protein
MCSLRANIFRACFCCQDNKRRDVAAETQSTREYQQSVFKEQGNAGRCSGMFSSLPNLQSVFVQSGKNDEMF